MPRNVDPGTIQVGKGLAPEGTVEDNALRYPERDVDPLRVHIHDPSRAHMAATIGIVDANDCYVSDEVEGALQELCSGSGAGRLNGLIAGGTFSELACAPNGSAGGVHATLTLCAPTEIMMNGTVLDAAGLTVSLPAFASTCFIYLDTEVSSPTYRELVASTVGPPQVEEGVPNATTGPGSIEQVMLAKVIVDGAGNITAWQDARFFVRNLDRKVQYSSRQGENVDAWSEGCFANLQAFFFWAEFYGDGALASSNEEEKGTILIRGTHSITAALTVPTDHLQFIGDGEAIIELNGVGAPYAAIETTKSDITFRNITFKTNLSGCVGISASGTYSDLTVEDCRFLSGTGNFNIGISAIGGPANERVLVRDCYIEAENTGVQADGFGSTNAFGIKAEDCTVKGFGQASSKGFILGTGTASGSAYIMGCSVKDMETGIHLRETSSTEISGCSITEAVTGIQFADGAPAITHKITNNTIVLTDNLSLHGIYVGKGNTQIAISDNYVRSLVSGNQPSEPYGIGLDVDAGAAVLGLTVTNNNIIGFYDATNNRGHGIAVFATGTAGTGASITGNTLSRCDIAVTQVSDITITGNSINAQGVWSGSPGPTVGAGISTAAASLVTITGNNISCGAVIPNGIEVRQGRHLTITANNVLGSVQNGILASATLVGGAGDAFMEHFTITGNTVDGYLNLNVAPTTNGILVGLSSDNGAPKKGVIDGNNIQKCSDGIIAQGFNTNIPVAELVISNNLVSECAHNQDVYDEDVWAQAGSKGIGVQYGKAISITGNEVTQIGTVLLPNGSPFGWADDVFPRAIYSLNSTVLAINGNIVTSSTPFGAGFVRDIHVRVGAGGVFVATQVQAHDNIVQVDESSAFVVKHEGISVQVNDSTNSVKLQELSIRGNTIHTVDGPSGSGVGYGIYIRSVGNSVISGSAVENNTVECYLLAAIKVLVGANTPTSNSDMSNTRIRGNSMFSMDATGPVAGVFVDVATDTAFEARLAQLSIEGNTIENGWGKGIYIQGMAASSTTGYIGLDGITVSGNHADNLRETTAGSARAFYMQLDGGPNERIRTGFPTWSLSGVRDIRLHDNRFTDINGRGFDLEFTDVVATTRLSIEDNTVQGIGSFTGTDDCLNRFSSLLTNVGQTQTVNMFSIRGNSFEIPNLNRTINNICCKSLNANWTVVSIEDNTLNACGVNANPQSHGLSIQWVMDGTGLNALGLSQKDVIISGNLLGGGVSWDVTQGDTFNMDVNGNQITIPVVTTLSGADTTAPLNILLDGQKIDGHKAQGIGIRGNTLSGGTHGSRVRLVDITTDVVTITDNIVQDFYTTGIAVEVDQEPLTLFYTDNIRNIKISDNTLSNVEYPVSANDDSTGIYYAAGKASTGTLEITDNQIYNCDVRGVHCLLGSEGSGNVDRCILLDGNTLNACGRAASALPLITLGVDPLSTQTVLTEASTLSISNNILALCGTTNGCVGIYAELSSYLRVTDLSIDGNVMTRLSGLAFNPPRLGSGIEVDVKQIYRASFSRNKIRVNGFDATSGYGISVDLSGTVAEDVTIESNQITMSGDVLAGVQWSLLFDGDVDCTSWSVTNNHINSVVPQEVEAGIQSKGVLGGNVGDVTLLDVVVDRNQIHDCASGVNIEYGVIGMKHNVTTRNCSADDNSVYGCSVTGIRWFSGGASVGLSTLGLSVSRNTVQTYFDNQDNGNMIDVSLGRTFIATPPSGVTVKMISLDNNHCYFTDPNEGDPSLWSGVYLFASVIGLDSGTGLPIPGGYTNISMDGNSIRNCGAYGVAMHLQGYYTLDVQNRVTGSTTADCISLSNNLIRRQTPRDFRGSVEVDLLGVSLRNFSLTNNMVKTLGTTQDHWGMYFQNSWGAADGVGTTITLATRWTVMGNCSNSPDSPASRPVFTEWNTFIPEKGTTIGNLADICANNDGFIDTNWDFGTQLGNTQT